MNISALWQWLKPVAAYNCVNCRHEKNGICAKGRELDFMMRQNPNGYDYWEYEPRNPPCREYKERERHGRPKHESGEED